MYYRLTSGLVLRGWDRLNGVLVKRPENQTKILSSLEFRVLMLCDGETDLCASDLPPEEKALLDRLVSRGGVEAFESPKPLDADQIYRLYPNRFVNSCFWSVTGRCNYRCRHCYLDAPEGALGELTHEEAMDLIDQMADCGVLSVDITGGEPFVRADFWQLVDRLLSHKITIGTVYSNGWLLTEAVLDAFEARGLRPGFSISFDGLGWHDWMRGVKGAEEAAVRALDMCRRRGFDRNVEMCLHKGNIKDLSRNLQFLAELGVPAVKCSNVSQTPLWRQNSQGRDLTQAEYVEEMMLYLPQFFRDGMPLDLVLSDFIILKKGSTEYEVVTEKRDGTESCLDCHLCGAARSSCYISPEGRLLPCMPVASCQEQELFGRVQDMGLRAGLSDSLYMQFVDKRVKDLLAVNKTCNECPHKLKCAGGCRAAALQQSSDLMGPDRHQCFLWENGYVERIHQVADEAIAKYRKTNP